MKVLKLKSILFSLMAVTLISILLTSCTKEPSFEVEGNVNQLETKPLEIFLPFDVALKSQEEIDEFLKESTYSEILTYKNNAIIFEFLQNENLLDTVISENVDVKSLSEINLSNYLSNEQIEKLNNKLLSISELENRDLCYENIEIEICVSVPTDWCKKEIPIFPDVWYPCNWERTCITHYHYYWAWCP